MNPCTDLTKPLYSSRDSQCHSCDYSYSIPLSELPDRKCTELCSNRKPENGQCVLASCPSDKPLMDANGGCHACDTETSVNVEGVEANCNVCSKEGRFLTTTTDKSYCVTCGVKGSKNADKPIISYSGGCYACNEKNDINIEKPAINCVPICPNRYAVNECCWCGLDYCTDDVPLMDVDKNCHPCNEPLPIDVGGDETKCGACLNRTLDGQYCILNSTES